MHYSSIVIGLAVESSRVGSKRKRRRTRVRPLLDELTLVPAYDLLMGELRATDTDLYSAFTTVSPNDFDFLLSVVKSHITGSSRYRYSITFSSCAMIGCNCLQQFLLMNILVQAQKYANEPATRCNSFIAAFILFYCRRPHMSAINAAIFYCSIYCSIYFILFYTCGRLNSD